MRTAANVILFLFVRLQRIHLARHDMKNCNNVALIIVLFYLRSSANNRIMSPNYYPESRE